MPREFKMYEPGEIEKIWRDFIENSTLLFSKEYSDYLIKNDFMTSVKLLQLATEITQIMEEINNLDLPKDFKID